MQDEDPSGLAITFMFIAALMLIATGLILLVYGGTTLLFGGGRDTSLALNISKGGWAIIFVAGGLFLTMAGSSIISGKSWGRTVGIVAGAIAILGSVLSIEAYPIWAIVMIVFNVLIVWSLAQRQTASPFA